MVEGQTKHIHILFLTILVILLIAPFACMTFAATERLSGSTEPVVFPDFLNDEGEINKNYLYDLGKYFEYHIAFRPQMVTANSLLRSHIFHESGTDQVIIGNNGFMYYNGTLNDYFGKNILSDSKLKVIAENLRIVQDYLEDQGRDFCFIVAPNKNSLYPQYMPYNYLMGTIPHNFDNLIPYLEKYKVNYINAFDIFKSNDNCLYLKEDSHWNNNGGFLISNNILKSFHEEEIQNIKWVNRNDRDGDLYIMEYPCIVGNENEQYAIGYNDKTLLTGDNWSFTYGSSYEDTLSATKSNLEGRSQETLYVFRDSFTNALMPYLSSSYNKAVFSKLLPFDIEAAVKINADDILIEKAERNLQTLAYTAPIMPALKYNNPLTCNLKNNSGWIAYLNTQTDGDFILVNGSVNEQVKELIEENNGALLVGINEADSVQLYKPFEYFNEEDDGLCFCARFLRSELNMPSSDFNLYLEINDEIIQINKYNKQID